MIFCFCQATGCPNPHQDQGGFVPFGASLEISCNEGFMLSGPESVTCLESGEFDAPVPRCIGKMWKRPARLYFRVFFLAGKRCEQHF